MKLKELQVANAFALTMAILWILCSVIVWLLPDFSIEVLRWWMHGMDVSVMGGKNFTLDTFVLGGLSAVATAWVSGYILGWSLRQVR